MHHVFEVPDATLRSAVEARQRAVEILTQLVTALAKCCYGILCFRSAVKISLSTEQLGRSYGTTALLFIKRYICTYTRTHACTYRGRIGERSKCRSAVRLVGVGA